MNKYPVCSPIPLWISILTALALLLCIANTVIAAPAVVHAVLFYSPSCPHCHEVIQEDLPPLIEKYGSSLNIIGINVSVAEGQKLYRAAVERFNIPDDRLGVPCLIIGDIVLVGAKEIPDQLPTLIEQGLAAGGIPLPDIPDLAEALAAAQTNAPDAETTQADVASEPLAAQPGEPSSEIGSAVPESGQFVRGGNNRLSIMLAKFNQDKAGNTISLIVLIGMVISVIGAGYQFLTVHDAPKPNLPQWIIPLLVLAGVGVALYLSLIEISQSQAVCGPVGDCNSVQQSPYSRLFGVLPIGVIGVFGYLAILAAWIIKRTASGRMKKSAELGIWLLALTGVIFSIYLTFLEPFVIGATCMWCITSAVLMTVLLLVSTSSARTAWRSLARRPA